MMLNIVILAAGQGTRMRSCLPKILHCIGGRPLLEHVVATAFRLNPAQSPIVIYGYQGQQVRDTLNHLEITWIEQTQQLGTGHALQQALPELASESRVLVLYGDVPLIESHTLERLIEETPPEGIGMITAHLTDPRGLGRIIRNAHQHITAIMEEKDATLAQRAITEINTGIYLIPKKYLDSWLPALQNNNAQQEFYLTDIIAMAVKENIPIHSISPHDTREIMGVNDRVQLAALERFYQQKQAEKWMRQGVTLLDPARFDVRGTAQIAQDVTVDINVILEGQVTIGRGSFIGANCILRNVVIGEGVEVKANSILEGAEIADRCIIGPFARIRPGTILSAGAHIGNFVEIKNSRIGQVTKINHLSYVGDSEVGEQVNIGAGTITCNYDGVNKNKTIIGKGAFIGSNTALVAPVTVGEGATIGANSTIRRNAPPHQLTLCRSEQRTIENWRRPEKKEKEK